MVEIDKTVDPVEVGESATYTIKAINLGQAPIINVPGQSFPKMNAECKFYADFPFHLLLTGDCKQLDSWLAQLLDVEDEGDFNILFMKFNRIGQYVCVQPKLTWIMDNYTFYASEKYGDWLITEKDSFFKNNKELVKTYSGSTDTTSKQTNSQILETQSVG